MLVIDAQIITQILTVKSLIRELKLTFQKSEFVPLRKTYNINKNNTLNNSQLLIMPAFMRENYYGVKLLNVFPKNPLSGMERVKALYVLFNKETGDVYAVLDGTELTKHRTAAMSALASQFLSSKKSKKLLILGTGSLVPYMISAHISVRPIEEVFVWGRNYEKAKKIVQNYKNNNIKLSAVKDLKSTCEQMDIICTVTSSSEPLLYNKWCKEGVHLDLVGSHTKSMIELDSEAFKLGDIYVEDINSALEEAGDLIAALNSKIISKKNIKGDITKLIKENKYVRNKKNQSTIFKSVGHPLSDLAAAILVHKNI